MRRRHWRCGSRDEIMGCPNIILIMTDQQRADTIGALGAPWMLTPNLDRLAREGTAFTERALGAFAWHLDPDMHPDNFVGNTACWWIDDRKNADPLLLQIGFPGPHPPYDPLPEWLERYADADIPVPAVSGSELAAQPRAHHPLLLEAAGAEVPADFEARSLWGALQRRADYEPRDTVYAELARDHIQTGSDFIAMRRCKNWKLVVYVDDEDGELYDLSRDPSETSNLWRSAPPERDRMAKDCIRWALDGALRANRRPARAPQRAISI